VNIEHRTSNIERRRVSGDGAVSLSGALGFFDVVGSNNALPTGSRRYSRLSACATHFLGCLSRGFARVLILLVRVYRVTLSPAKTVLFGPAGECRFEPSCSQYAIEALQTHGALSGSWLAAKRICRCHPWGECGKDPVPGKFQAPSSKFQIANRQSAIGNRL
jgi:putative membrane protein insertion efficiency factor